jgi:nucleoid-associated protein YgaU
VSAFLCLMLVACGQEAGLSSDASAGSAEALAVQVVEEVPNGPSPADQRATIDARYALAGDPGVDLRQFRVRVESGVATLESSTADAVSRERARTLVAAVSGVREVQIVGVVPAAAVEGSWDGTDAVVDTEVGVGSGFPPADSLVQLGDPASNIEAPAVLEGSGAAAAETGAAAAETGAAPVAVVSGEPTAVVDANDRAYTVQPGDNLSGIAEREMGDRGAWRRLYEHNRSVIGSSPERLRDGMVLRIPGARP